MLEDGLAFDVRTWAWSNILTPPGPPRAGASMAVVGAGYIGLVGTTGSCMFVVD